MAETLPPIIQVNLHLWIKGYALMSKFDFNTILIDRLHEAVALVLVNIQACSDDLIGFLLEKNVQGI